LLLFSFFAYKSGGEAVVEIAQSFIFEEPLLVQIALFLGLEVVLLRTGEDAVDWRIGDDSRASLPTRTFWMATFSLKRFKGSFLSSFSSS
jgi:hypothetical protein